MRIRSAQPEDVAAIADCARLAFGQYSAAIGRDPAPMKADFAAHVAAREAHVAVSESGAFLGYVVLLPRADHLYLDALAVMPEAAGHGIGRALVAFAEDQARELGLARLDLCTNQRMTANLTLYPHLGFSETGRGHEDGYDRVFYTKRLGPDNGERE
ncbi:GNAT family N-acetyltransferase [Rhodobacter maris]|uniref:L-amino acid N-acyltransferase YncA n=1 Tax=Rhodobacter maris TaxID=446682 RepID=A0A285RKJ8_9RHOB|nr:GNAT family N-acetyltransferase [Rhodobacter maris]SOB94209.1 L-amino acid N-acyltransferase YncA [Rhodobacter maris]